jgi:excisionase family DNA binding protein
MRGFGKFQQSQMKRADTRIPEMIGHVRAALDVFEQIMLYPYSPRMPEEPPSDIPSPPLASSSKTEKLAYSVKEVHHLVGISRAKIYQAIKEKELRAVRFGQRILVPVKELHAWIESRPSL